MTTVRWGLIGAGDIVRKRVAAALREAPHSELVSVSRARAVLVEYFAAELGARKSHFDWHDLVKDHALDAVYVATPVNLHAEMTIAAAEAGKHVLCEKPMALNRGQCERMIEACEKAGVQLGVAYYRHFYPVIQRMKELLAQETIGRPVVVQVNAFEKFNPAPTEPRYWLLDPKRSGGGPMMDFGCHRIEVLLHLFGEPSVALGYTDAVVYDREVEDTAGAVFDFPGGPRATLTVGHAVAEPQDTLDIFGTEGSLHVKALNEGDLTIVRDGESRTENHPPHENLHQPLVEDFVAALREGRKPAVDGQVGLAVNRLLDDIYGR